MVGVMKGNGPVFSQLATSAVTCSIAALEVHREHKGSMAVQLTSNFEAEVCVGGSLN